MNRLQKFILRKIAKVAVKQGNHEHNVTEFYRILVEEAKVEFCEDNRPTIEGFLNDCHNQALKG